MVWLMKKEFAKSSVNNTNHCTHLFHIMIERCLKLIVKLKKAITDKCKTGNYYWSHKIKVEDISLAIKCLIR